MNRDSISKIAQLNDIIQKSSRIVFFGGAGVSTASGIPDFRSPDGLFANMYENKSPEDILSATYFAYNTEAFYDFYRKYMLHPTACPNIVHRKLYELERMDKLRGIVTQNIDGLHKKAGNIRVYELHGSVYENYCVDCETNYPIESIMKSTGIPRCCECGGIIKPNVVLYGDNLDKYTCIGAQREIANADTMIIAGTSLAVDPAASFVKGFGGKHLVVINSEVTPADDMAGLIIHEDIAEVFDLIQLV